VYGWTGCTSRETNRPRTAARRTRRCVIVIIVVVVRACLTSWCDVPLSFQCHVCHDSLNTKQTRIRWHGRQTLFRQTLFRQTLFRQSAARTTQYIFSTLGICRNSRNWEETGMGRGVGCIKSTALIKAPR